MTTSDVRLSLLRMDPALVVVITVSLLIRLGWILAVPNQQYSDSVWYDAAAANLALHGYYGPGDASSAWFPPGYPVFLAVIYKLVGHVELAGKLGNVALSGALTGFTFALGKRLAGRGTALLGGLLIALWPNLIFSTGILSSDILAAAGFSAAIWLGMLPVSSARGSAARSVALGLLVGWMVLVRPVSVILLGSLGLWWWISRGSLRRALPTFLPVTLIASLLVCTWGIRNFEDFHQVILISTNGGYNLWQSNQPYADGSDNFWSSVPADDQQAQIMRGSDEFTRNTDGFKFAISFLQEHPEQPIRLLPDKLGLLYRTDTSGYYEGLYYAPMDSPSSVSDWMHEHAGLVESTTVRYYEAIMILAAVSIPLLVRKQWRWILPIVSLPILLTCIHAFFEAKDRYHIPLDPFFALLAGAAIVCLWSSVSSSSTRAAPKRTQTGLRGAKAQRPGTGL